MPYVTPMKQSQPSNLRLPNKGHATKGLVVCYVVLLGSMNEMGLIRGKEKKQKSAPAKGARRTVKIRKNT